MSILSINDISLDYNGRSVLSDVSMSVERGQIVTIVGPNGSGKSTLLRGIVGALPLSKGEINKAHNLKIGYVPQRLSLDRNMPMRADRFLRLMAPGIDVTKALHSVGLKDVSTLQMNSLSGGQFQRLLLASAIYSEPDLLLLDEPTQGLDQPATAEFYRLIETTRKKLDCAVLMVSHDLHVVMSTSDQVICLNGHVCCQGPPKVVSKAPEYRALFGTGTEGALALYQHDHDHAHDHAHWHNHGHDHHAG